jgi:5-methylcytosine-specific restriction endonuclease McrA
MSRRIGSIRRRKIFSALRARHGDNCHWCAFPMTFGEDTLSPLAATVEHLIPLSVGGPNAQSNLRLAHRFCNEARARMGRHFSPTAILSELEGVQ